MIGQGCSIHQGVVIVKREAIVEWRSTREKDKLGETPVPVLTRDSRSGEAASSFLSYEIATKRSAA
jgi:hypothetical protein